MTDETSYHEGDSGAESAEGATRRERAARFVDRYIDEHRALFDKLARE